jgi:hypothetical protein
VLIRGLFFILVTELSSPPDTEHSTAGTRFAGRWSGIVLRVHNHAALASNTLALRFQIRFITQCQMNHTALA